MNLRIRAVPVILAAASAALAISLPLAAQQAPQSVAPAIQQPQSAEKPAHKVWMNEDLIAMRTPADAYLLEKEARAAALAEAAMQAASAKSANHSAEPATQDLPHTKLPATIEETQRMIDEDLRDIDGEQAGLPQAQKDLDAAPEDQKAEKQKQLERLTKNLEVARTELKDLQHHLEVLRNKPTDNDLNASAILPQ